jgi:hypothetical protein
VQNIYLDTNQAESLSIEHDLTLNEKPTYAFLLALDENDQMISSTSYKLELKNDGTTNSTGEIESEQNQILNLTDIPNKFYIRFQSIGFSVRIAKAVLLLGYD